MPQHDVRLLYALAEESPSSIFLKDHKPLGLLARSSTMASPSWVQHLHLSSSDSLAIECMKHLRRLQVLPFALLPFTDTRSTLASRTLPDHPTSCTQTVAFPSIPPASGLNLDLNIPAISSNHGQMELTQAWRCRYHVSKPRDSLHSPQSANVYKSISISMQF